MSATAAPLAGTNPNGRPHPSPTPQLEQDVLDRGRRIVRGQRALDYGPPERNLTAIAQVWTAMFPDLPFEFTARDVALMFAGMKLIRASSRLNDDDLTDCAGYLLLADEASEAD